jgi:hypothetical protein
VTLKVYADNDVISTLRRWDQTPQENAAIQQLKERSDKGDITLMVSAVHDREAARLRDDRKETQTQILALLPKVEFVDDHRLTGFNTFGDRYTWISSPLIEDDPAARQLREIGLDRVDAHHVMLAIRSECDAFVTCDVRTILTHRDAVEAAFPIRLMRPSEFIQRYPAPS